MMHQSPRLHSKLTGFTLVEVLIALSIMAVISIMGWQGINQMMMAQQGSKERSMQVSHLQTALAQWVDDMDHISYDSTYMMERTPIKYDGTTLRLLRFDNMDLSARKLLVVAWTKRADGLGVDRKEASGQLLRWESEPITTRDELLRAWRDARLWGDAQTAAEAGKLRDREVAILPVQDWEMQVADESLAWTYMPINTDMGNITRIKLLRIQITPANNSVFVGPITRAWIRPSFARIN